MAKNRQFKGVWIAADIWNNSELTILQKCMLAEIDSLSSPEEPFEESDEYLCKFLNAGSAVIVSALGDLVQKGYLRIKNSRGTRKIIIQKEKSTKKGKSNTLIGSNTLIKAQDKENYIQVPTLLLKDKVNIQELTFLQSSNSNTLIESNSKEIVSTNTNFLGSTNNNPNNTTTNNIKNNNYSTNNSKDSTNNNKIIEYFNYIYKIFPKHVSKVQAQTTFEHKLVGLSEEEINKKTRAIYDLLKKQIQSWQKENGGEGRKYEFIPELSTWLNKNIEDSPYFTKKRGRK